MQVLGTFLHTRNRRGKAKTSKFDSERYPGGLICSDMVIFVVLPHSPPFKPHRAFSKSGQFKEVPIKHTLNCSNIARPNDPFGC